MSEEEHKVLKIRRRRHLQNVPMPTPAGTPYFAEYIKPKHHRHACVMRITVSLSAPHVLSARIKRHDNVQVVDLNEGDPLNPNALYVFDVEIQKHDSINYSCSGTDGTIMVARVDEVDAGAGAAPFVNS